MKLAQFCYIVVLLCLMVAPVLLIGSACTAADTNIETLAKVADAIMQWDGGSPGDLFKLVKAANPDTSAIVSMRELNKALADKKVSQEVMAQADAIIQKEKSAQSAVRDKVFSSRDASYSKFRSNNEGQSRSIYGNGDIGSWPTAEAPDASMDIDYTVFGVDPNATAALRDQCKKDLLSELAGEDSGLTLADFDVVVTAEGHEAAAGVFETEGGIDWAKRNMKRVTIVYQNGTKRTFSLIGSKPSTGPDGKKDVIGDPIGEMANEEHMAKFRDLATKNSDYEKIFDEKGSIRTQIFEDPMKKTPMDQKSAKELWDKYMDMLSSFGVDYYVSRTDTATGGCLDMAKHLQEEVITKKHEPKAKLKKTLKYVSRADNISRGVPGLEKLMAADPILGDPAYKDVVDLARQVGSATPAQLDAIIVDRFGEMPDAGLQELGSKAKRTILRMSEVAFQAEMDRIILEVPDKGARKAALDKLTDDFRTVANEGGEYSDLARSATDQIAKVQEANDAGTVEAIKKNYASLEKIRQADSGLIKQTTEFLNQTELGKKMLDMGGKILEIGQTPINVTAEPQYKSSAVEFIGEITDTARAKSMKIMDVAGSVAMWADVVDNVRTAKNNADLTIALGKTLVSNTFFGMVLNTAYAGVVQGDNNALGKAIMYMLVPETALPALVEALGNTAINVTTQTLFDTQMEKVYAATTFDADSKITDFSGLGMDGPSGAKYFVDTMCDGAPEEVAEDIISKSKATDAGKGVNAIAIKAISKTIKSTVENGNVLIFKEDGPLLGACAGIKKCTEDIGDCAKIWGVEVALSASNKGDLPNGLDIGQTRALVKLMDQREKYRVEARVALAAVMVRTFEERRRAEASLDSGKAQEEYNALKKIFEDLGITKEATATLDTEGAPYNIITNWTTSTREKQITAVKAVQKFKDAYSIVLQSRGKAESAARNVMGDGYSPDPRPLTNSLPLTGSPELDVDIAKAYLAEVAKVGESATNDLELIKKSDLKGEYDESMLKKLHEVRYKQAYWLAMMKAASDAQKLHWAVEIFDKQELYSKHSEAAAKHGELTKLDMAILDEFRKHYALEGDFIVELKGPDQIQSGQEAKLACLVKIKPKNGDAQPVPDDIAKQFAYAWASGKTALGEGVVSEKSYKLDTVGSHAFVVAVTKKEMVNGKLQSQNIGKAEFTVKVVPDIGITVKIDGKTTAKPDDVIDLKAVVEAEKSPLPELKYMWTAGKISLGDKQAAQFTSKTEGNFEVKLAVSAKINDKWVPAGTASQKIKVSKTQEAGVAVQGAKDSLPGVKTRLKAVITVDKASKATFRCIWKEGDTSLGEGETLDYISSEEKSHKITVVLLGMLDGKESEVARVDHDLKVANDDKTAGGVTAAINGIKAEVVEGGSLQLSVGSFKKGDETLVTAEDDDIIPYLNLKWEAYYRSTHKGEDLSDIRSIPIRPKGWGIDKFKVIWHSEPALPFSPGETINNEATSLVASGKRDATVTVWGDIQQDKDGKFISVGRTDKGSFVIGRELITVTLEATKTSLKPGETVDVLATVTGYGAVPPFRYEWTGDHAGASADMSKVSFSSRKGGQYVLSCEVTDSKGQKGTASIGLTVVAVTAKLQGVKEQVVYGDKLPLSVKIEGLDKILESVGAKKKLEDRKDEWVLTAIERKDRPVEDFLIDYRTTGVYTDSSFDGNMPHPNAPIHVTAKWALPAQRIKPGGKAEIPWSIDGNGTKMWDGDGTIQIGIGEDYNNGIYDSIVKKTTQGYGSIFPVRDSDGNDVKVTSGTFTYQFPEGLPGKEIKISVDANAEYSADGSHEFAGMRRIFVYKFGKDDPVKVDSPVKVIWQSEPAITFDPASSLDQKTTARFDRIGMVKVWGEIQIRNGEIYETVGETEQVETNVVAPNFKITFEPPEGQGKVGQEIKATITKDLDPQLDPSIVNYAWTDPTSSNRMELNQNASSINFKLKDANPVSLLTTAKVPIYMDVISEIKGTYTPSVYTIKAEVTGTNGPKPQIWKEGVGLVEIEKGTYAADEQVNVKATIEGDPAPTDVRWKWTANEGTTVAGGDISQEAIITRNETGTAEATVEARDKDGVFLGKATASFPVTVSAEAIKSTKDKGGVIELTLNAPKSSIVSGGSLKLSASAKGGKAPYTYSWSGECKGSGASATFSSKKVGEQTVTVTVNDSKGKSASKSLKIEVKSPNLAVVLKADRTSLAVNESVIVKADISGGKPPYTVKWTGSVEGAGQSTRFTGPAPGTCVVSASVTDAKKKTVSARISFNVQEFVPTFTGVSDQVVVGDSVIASVTYPQSPAGSKINAKPLPTIYWHTEPTMKMSVSQSDAPLNTITLDQVGQVKIWAEIIGRTGKTLGKTAVKSVNVIAPKFDLEFTVTAKGKAIATVKAPAGIDPSRFTFKWMRPTGGLLSSPESLEFTPDTKTATDVFLIIRMKDTSTLVQEIKTQYQPGQGKTDDSGKKVSGTETASKPVETPSTQSTAAFDKAKAEQIATQKIEQAKTLAANGKLDEAVKLVDEAGKTVPEKAAAARKDFSKEASAWSGNGVAELDFKRAEHLADLATKLDPSSEAAKANQSEVLKWSGAWAKSEQLRPQFDKQLADNKVVSAEKTYKDVSNLIGEMPAAPKVQPILHSMLERSVKARDAQTAAIQPYRKKIMAFIDQNAHENAIPLCEEVLNGKVVPELYPTQEKEFRDWLNLCNSKAASRAVTKKTTTKPADTKPQVKKKGNIFDDVSGKLDKITKAIDKVTGKETKKDDKTDTKTTTTPSNDKPVQEPKKPTTVVDIGNTGGCSLTDKSTFKLDNTLRVTQLIIWASWGSAEQSVNYELSDSNGKILRKAVFDRGGADTYQKNWCNGVDEPNITLPAGTYTVKVPKAMIGQNSGTGGNGMIKVITGGLLVPAGHPESIKPDTKPEVKPLKPVATAGGGCPSGWLTKSAGNITLCIPSNWLAIDQASPGEGAWYTGDKDNPDVGFGVLRQHTVDELISQIEIHSQATITVSGMPATSYIGKAKADDLVGWLVAVKNGSSDGKPIYFIGLGKPGKWESSRPLLEKILGTVHIGKPAVKVKAVAPKPKPTPKPAASTSKMVTAIFMNQASDNVHIFVEGECFDPSNRLTPGQKKNVAVKMPATGRIKFICGRGGDMLDTKIWDGDPDDTSRVPRVIFDSSGKLLITTILQ